MSQYPYMKLSFTTQCHKMPGILGAAPTMRLNNPSHKWSTNIALNNARNCTHCPAASIFTV
jgi:hypothetical protein